MMRQIEDDFDIPLAAMVDVVFLLLIFFVATYIPERVEAHISINTPVPSKQKIEQPPIVVEIHVHPDHYELTPGNIQTLDVIESYLYDRYAKNDPEQMITVKIVPETPQYRLMDLLDRCHKLGLTNFTIDLLKD